MATPLKRPQPSGNSKSLMLLLAALLVSLICGGCGTPVKKSKGFDREFNEEAYRQALTKVNSLTDKVVIGQHNRKQVERVLGKPELIKKGTDDQGRKVTRYTYSWLLAQTLLGSGPVFTEVESFHVLELVFDADGMLVGKKAYSRESGMRPHRY